MALSHQEQLRRFGMTQDEANALKERVMSSVDQGTAELARAIWTGQMVAELRGRPADLPHPEAVRFRMLENLAKGWTAGEAAEAAMKFARGEAQ